MKPIALTLACVMIGFIVACDDAQDPGPVELQVQSAAEDLIDRLPNSTLAAFEIRDLDSRWLELRALPPLARLQDQLLGKLGLDADDVPEIAGSHAVLALVADEARRVVPVAVLDPPSPGDALQRLSDGVGLVAVEARGAIWVGPASRAQWIALIAAGDGTALRHAVDFGVLAERLPAGGLVRAVLNPRAISGWLRRWAEYRTANPAGALARLLAADLEGIEVAGFRRDIANGELVTDIWVGIDTEVVPAVMMQALAEHRGPAVLPRDLPADVLLAKSFRTEAEGGLAWLRALAASDPAGPLRQLDFWIAEFEARSGRDVERDIVGALGERGLFIVLEGAEGGLETLAIFDAREPERLEAALVDLRDWLADHIWGRTLGLAIPQRGGPSAGSGAAVHALAFWSPFGSVSGPAFQLADDRLVVATSRQSLSYGVELAGSAATWHTPAWALADGREPDEIAVIRPAGLSRFFGIESALIAGRGPGLGAVQEFIAGAGEGRVRVFYDEGGFSIHGVLRIEAAGPGG